MSVQSAKYDIQVVFASGGLIIISIPPCQGLVIMVASTTKGNEIVRFHQAYPNNKEKSIKFYKDLNLLE